MGFHWPVKEKLTRKVALSYLVTNEWIISKMGVSEITHGVSSESAESLESLKLLKPLGLKHRDLPPEL